MSDEAFSELWYAKTPGDVAGIIRLLGDTLDWVPLGDNPGNFGIISMGSDPFDGITERITNSMDAMIELEAETNGGLLNCRSPREAIEKIHGFKEGNLRWADQAEIGRLSSDIKVVFMDGGSRARPTVEVWDRGIGQHPSDFPDTLVSLNSDYKVKKLHLIGAFGQGGQTSFAHCQYGIIVSRKAPELLANGQQDSVGWTIVRYRDPTTPEEIHKRGLWEYCVDARTGEVLRVSPSSLPAAFEHGTMVRLVAYDLVRGTSDVLQPASTGWSYLSESLFDPVLPFRLYESRDRFEKKNRSFSGLAPRLWRGGRGRKVQIAMQDSYEIELSPHGSLRLNYWAMEPILEPDTKTRWKDIKKGYVSGRKAVFLTLNGQRHGVETTRYLKEKVKLAYASDFVIVQVDCDNLTNLAKKEIFSTTRDRLREGELKQRVMSDVAEHLAKDRNLLAFEKERKNAIIRSRTRKDTSKIRRMVARFIAKNPALSALIMKETKQKEDESKAIREPSEEVDEDQIRESELETPDLREIPTYLKITNASDPIPVEKGGHALVRLETDAVDEFLSEGGKGQFRATHASDITKRKSSSELRNGKISYRMFCPTAVRVGTTEMLSFDLLLPGGSSLRAERLVRITKPKERKKERGKRKLPEPNIVAVSENGDPDLWQKLDFDERSVGKVYLTEKIDPAIYVSLDNGHFKRVLSGRGLSEEIVEDVNDRYVSAIAYHLLLMHVDNTRRSQDLGEDVDLSEERDEMERTRLAQTVAALSMPIESL